MPEPEIVETGIEKGEYKLLTATLGDSSGFKKASLDQFKIKTYKKDKNEKKDKRKNKKSKHLSSGESDDDLPLERIQSSGDSDDQVETKQERKKLKKKDKKAKEEKTLRALNFAQAYLKRSREDVVHPDDHSDNDDLELLKSKQRRKEEKRKK